ncbi:hypothetical protein [Candidatus Lokiarchaeum ossiferum]|uniref:hypothetical protein n=1 Tax=Candidatus Lokiarchaeum ossiferum TaxID=2951803 RepID=UPI00352CCE3B
MPSSLSSSPGSKYLMFFEYLGLLLVIAFVQLVIPFPPAYWVLYGVLGICGVSLVYVLYSKGCFFSSQIHHTPKFLQRAGFEVGLLIVMGFCVCFCSEFCWTFGFSEAEAAIYAGNFKVFSSLLTCIACVLIVLQGLPLLLSGLKMRVSPLAVEV